MIDNRDRTVQEAAYIDGDFCGFVGEKAGVVELPFVVGSGSKDGGPEWVRVGSLDGDSAMPRFLDK